MKTIGKSFKQHYILWTCIITFITLACLRLIRKLPIGLLNSYLLSEVVVAAIVIFFLYSISGTSQLKFSAKGMGYAFKLAWWPLLFALAGMGLLIFYEIYQGHQPLGNPVLIILECAVLSILVGIFEETLMRGFLLSCFLDTRGNTFKGVLFSCIVSSILFGFLHVYSDFIDLIVTPGTFSFTGLFQIFGKTLTTGMFGFILAVIYLRNHNLWSVAIIHAINDFGPFVPNFLYENSNIARSYVDTSGSMLGLQNEVGYIIQFFMVLPVVIYAYRQLKKVHLPQLGLFKETYTPRNVSK